MPAGTSARAERLRRSSSAMSSAFSQFLTLVALTALLVGGVGVANAVASHLARKRDAIATMKASGATGTDIFGIYCAQILLVALFATLIGAGIGAGLPFAIVGVFGAHHSASGRAGFLSRRAPAFDPVRAVDRTGLRVVAARPRARHFGLDAVPRRDRRRAALAAAALHDRHRIDHRSACGACGPRRL